MVVSLNARLESNNEEEKQCGTLRQQRGLRLQAAGEIIILETGVNSSLEVAGRCGKQCRTLCQQRGPSSSLLSLQVVEGP